MTSRISDLLTASSLVLGLFPALAGADADCSSVSECNREGTAAYQSKDSAAASAHFARQIDFAETELADTTAGADGDGDRDRAAGAANAARNLAINNAALAELQAGECRKASAFLGLADAGSRATLANLRQWQKRCSDVAIPDGPIGDYWQYAGHGAWNKITLRPTGDETLSLDAFWMRISRGPLDFYGLAAFGELRDVAVFVDGARASGRYEGVSAEAECSVSFELSDESLEVRTSQQAECEVGGAGALLRGRYQRVSIHPSTNSEQN